ncbi:hypothetical protein [Bartonella doshiae]|uniref:hypothetical protein n=1 Tax=Bartonella doshiae TaxID=33044 RepID=UPI000A7C79C3
MMQHSVVCLSHKLTEKGAQPASAHLRGRLIYDQALSLWFENALQQIFDIPATNRNHHYIVQFPTLRSLLHLDGLFSKIYGNLIYVFHGLLKLFL